MIFLWNSTRKKITAFPAEPFKSKIFQVGRIFSKGDVGGMWAISTAGAKANNLNRIVEILDRGVRM